MSDSFVLIGTHDWARGESVQWGMAGLSPSAAATPYTCRKCGASFTHRYNVQPSIYKAAEDAGIGACEASLHEPAKEE